MEMPMAVTRAALQKIGESGFDPVHGAPPQKRAIWRQIENPLPWSIPEGRSGLKDSLAVNTRKANS